MRVLTRCVDRHDESALQQQIDDTIKMLETHSFRVLDVDLKQAGESTVVLFKYVPLSDVIQFGARCD